MIANQTGRQEFIQETEKFMEHSVAIIAGMVLMIFGLGMGVTVVLLPIGIPVGFVGLLFFFWGLFGRSPKATGG